MKVKLLCVVFALVVMTVESWIVGYHSAEDIFKYYDSIRDIKTYASEILRDMANGYVSITSVSLSFRLLSGIAISRLCTKYKFEVTERNGKTLIEKFHLTELSVNSHCPMKILSIESSPSGVTTVALSFAFLNVSAMSENFSMSRNMGPLRCRLEDGIMTVRFDELIVDVTTRWQDFGHSEIVDATVTGLRVSNTTSVTVMSSNRKNTIPLFFKNFKATEPAVQELLCQMETDLMTGHSVRDMLKKFVRDTFFE